MTKEEKLIAETRAEWLQEKLDQERARASQLALALADAQAKARKYTSLLEVFPDKIAEMEYSMELREAF